MSRAPGTAIVAAVLVAAAGTVALVRYQGLDRANLWAGVLALFLAIIAVVAQLWSAWSGVPAGGRPATATGQATAADPDFADPDVAGLRRLLRAGRWSTRAVLAAVAAATVIFVLVVVNVPPGGPEPPADPEWVQVRAGTEVTLADHQTYDLDAGTLGGEYAVGRDILLTQRADRLGAEEPGELAVLDPSVEPSVRRCLDATNWDGTIDGLHGLPPGSSICVRTGDRRCAILTVDSPPDVVMNVLTFRYTLWERR
jgi:hypothetical protein